MGRGNLDIAVPAANPFTEKPRKRGFSIRNGAPTRYATFGSLNASISPANASSGTQLQNTFLSP